MKIKILISIATSLLVPFALFAQDVAKESAVGVKTLHIHKMAHQQQLANAKMRMDKNVLKDFVKNDIQTRESDGKDANGLSAESRIMIKDLLNEANSHMGKRYRSGAKGPAAFDCSGFAGYVYRQFGFELGSSSRAQYNDGVEVAKNDLREGDLVFFKGRNSKGGIGHVGIVVSADNEKGTFKFIHASTSGGIKVDGSEGYYGVRYVGARRVITE